MDSGSEVNGLTLDANGNAGNGLGINTFDGGDAAGTRWLANSHLKDSTGDVLLAWGEGAVFRIDNSRFTGSTGTFGNGSGVEAKRGGTIYISNSYIADNGGHGLHADGDAGIGGTIIADHMLIENNGLLGGEGSGVDSNGGGSFVRITDSVVRNNEDGLIANWSTTTPNQIIADRLLVTDNLEQAVYATGGYIKIDNSIISNNGFGQTDEGDDPTHISTFDVGPGGLIAETYSDDIIAGTIDAHNVVITGNYRGILSKGENTALGITSTVNITGDSTLSDNTRGDFFNNFECTDPSGPFVGEFQTGTITVDGQEVPLTTPIYTDCN